MKSFALTMLATSVAANSIPIYGNYPGWVEGQDGKNISVEIFYDLLCSDSKAANPTVEKLLATEWLGATVFDQITVAYTPFPLPYHNHTWQVNQLVPFFDDLCAKSKGEVTEGDNCVLDKYKDFAFENQEWALGETDMNKNDFVKAWSQKVADEFGFPVDQIELCYDRANDPHDTEDKLRAMWKYGTGKGVSGAPVAFVNGVKLDSFPNTVDEWMEMLNSIVESQWGFTQ